jgi:hypothetical protein
MYKVFVWVPTKGWKKVGAFKEADKARELARELEPLEVQVQRGNQKWWGGQLCMVDYNVPANRNTLGEIS